MAQVALSARVAGADDGTEVRFTIDGEGSCAVPVVDGEAAAQLRIENVRRWHGQRDPHLYTARAEALRDGELVDDVSVRFGSREIAVDPERGFLLNGEESPRRSVSRNQDWEGARNEITGD